MKIGEIADKAQCTVQTVRYYERAGLLPAPERSTGNFRTYDNSHVDRLRFIRKCRALDMAQDDIRGLLDLMSRPKEDCSAVNHLVDVHIRQIDAKIAEMAQLRDELSSLRHTCQSKRTVDACAVLRGLWTKEGDNLCDERVTSEPLVQAQCSYRRKHRHL